MGPFPDTITQLSQLDDVMAEPYPELVSLFEGLDGDLIVLGAGGKMGPSLVHLALTACRRAGRARRVIAVSRFSEPDLAGRLAARGAEVIRCDLLDPAAVGRLPHAANVVFMAGRKFGAAGSEPATWAANTELPAIVARRFRGSRIVAFSTGCVYPLASPAAPGCRESDPPGPVGEYSWSCLGRERLLEHASLRDGTPVLLFRLNYAVDLRYGILLDLAQAIHAGSPVDRSVSAVNLIWQGDANNRALLCLAHAASPPAVLNVTGPARLSVEDLAVQLGREMNRPVTFAGVDSGLAYLSDAGRSIALFGPPRVGVGQMIRWVARWVEMGGPTLAKPTQFRVTDGDFLRAAPADAPVSPAP